MIRWWRRLTVAAEDRRWVLNLLRVRKHLRHSGMTFSQRKAYCAALQPSVSADDRVKVMWPDALVLITADDVVRAMAAAAEKGWRPDHRLYPPL